MLNRIDLRSDGSIDCRARDRVHGHAHSASVRFRCRRRHLALRHQRHGVVDAAAGKEFDDIRSPEGVVHDGLASCLGTPKGAAEAYLSARRLHAWPEDVALSYFIPQPCVHAGASAQVADGRHPRTQRSQGGPNRLRTPGREGVARPFTRIRRQVRVGVDEPWHAERLAKVDLVLWRGKIGGRAHGSDTTPVELHAGVRDRLRSGFPQDSAPHSVAGSTRLLRCRTGARRRRCSGASRRAARNSDECTSGNR